MGVYNFSLQRTAPIHYFGICFPSKCAASLWKKKKKNEQSATVLKCRDATLNVCSAQTFIAVRFRGYKLYDTTWISLVMQPEFSLWSNVNFLCDVSSIIFFDASSIIFVMQCKFSLSCNVYFLYDTTWIFFMMQCEFSLWCNANFLCDTTWIFFVLQFLFSLW